MSSKRPRKAPRSAFKKGCKPGPGRPSRAAELSYLQAIKVGCPEEELITITKKAVAEAKRGGNVGAKAREWLTKQLGTEAAQKIEQSLSVTTVTERRIRLEAVSEETRKIASDLAVAIYSPVVHRDVKPENILGSGNGTNGAAG